MEIRESLSKSGVTFITVAQTNKCVGLGLLLLLRISF